MFTTFKQLAKKLYRTNGTISIAPVSKGTFTITTRRDGHTLLRTTGIRDAFTLENSTLDHIDVLFENAEER